MIGPDEWLRRVARADLIAPGAALAAKRLLAAAPGEGASARRAAALSALRGWVADLPDGRARIALGVALAREELAGRDALDALARLARLAGSPSPFPIRQVEAVVAAEYDRPGWIGEAIDSESAT